MQRKAKRSKGGLPRNQSSIMPHWYHEDHVAAKVIHSVAINLVHKWIPMLEALKIPDAKAAVEKNGKIGKDTGTAADKSQKQRRGDRRSKEWGQKSSFCVIDGSLSSQEFGVRTSISKVQRQSRTPRWHCKRWFWCVRSIHWTRIVSVPNDSRKSHGHYFKTTRMRRTSSRCSIRLHPGQNGSCTDVIEHSQIGMSRHLDTSIEREMAKIMVQYGWPSRSSWAKSVRSSFDRTIMGTPIWESSIRTRLGKVPNWECLFVHSEKGLFSYVYVDDIKLAGKTENIEPTWQILMEDVDLGEPTSFLDHVYLRCTQRECQICKDFVDNYRSMFESRISAGSMENYQKKKLRRNLMPKRYLHGPMTWKVMPRNAWIDIANLRIKRRNNCTK